MISFSGQERVSGRLRRMYQRVAEQEARVNTRPLASGVVVTPMHAFDEQVERRLAGVKFIELPRDPG